MRKNKEINIAELQLKRYLTNREAQAYLSKSHTTMWRLVRAGEIAYSRTGLSLLSIGTTWMISSKGIARP